MAKKSAKAAKLPSPARSSSSASSSSSSASSSSGSEQSSSPAPESADAARAERPAKSHNSSRTSKYKPPKGLKLVSGLVDRSAIDFDDLTANPELELWAIRVPQGIKPSALDGMTIKLPSHRSNKSLATFTPKKSSAEYELFFADESIEALASEEQNVSVGEKRKRVDEDSRGGEEMRSLVPLLPKKSGGDKLYAAPRPLAHHLVITRTLPKEILRTLPKTGASSSLIASQPSPVPGAILSAAELLQPEVVAAKKIKREQPAGLKSRILLPGMRAVGGRGTFSNAPPVVEGLEVAPEPVKMEVDAEVASPKKARKEGKSKKVKKEKE